MARIALIVLVITASACAAKEAPVSERAPPSGHSTPLPAPRDGQAAVREEFDAAARANTAAAWDLFIARHPDNELTGRARTARAALEAKP
jgi:hypothetical protein